MGVDKTENIALTCDICRRKFTKTQYLTAHRKYVHKIAILPTKLRKRLRQRGKLNSEPVKLVKKTKIKPKITKSSSVTMSPPKLKTNVESSVSSTPEKVVSPLRRTMFKCPKCIKIFNVYFSAYKHIQKSHCVDANDQPVEQNSPQLIKPIRIDPCETCQKPKLEKHECETITNSEDKDKCTCLGCHKTFDNLELFEQHVKELHAGNIESYFFSNYHEYTSWKIELEHSTRTKFATKNSDSKTKQSNQIYYCSHQPVVETNKILLCPSHLQIIELKNGYLINYYKEHYGHYCSEFSTTKYKKYCITSYLDDFDIKNLNIDINNNDLFKILTNNIIEKSVDANLNVFNTLLCKVLEMTVVLNTPVNDLEQNVKKKMTDDQISEILAEVKTYPSKRKQVVEKKIDENNDNSTSSENSTQFNRALLQSPPSFNDSYKDFVDQTISKKKFDPPLRNSSVKKKVVMKTKIGQFIPSLSPKDTVPSSKSPKRKHTSPNTSISNKKLKPVLNESSDKPVTSPRNETDTRTPSKTPLKSKTLRRKKFKPIPDIKYEVKEQENDCNILILKI